MLPIGTTLALLAIWQVLGAFHLWDPLFFSTPSQIWSGFIHLSKGPLLDDLATSGYEFFLGLGITLAVSIPIGIVLGSNRRLYMAFDPIISALYATPVVVLTPLLVIWFGLGTGSKVANVVAVAALPLVINIMEGVRTIDPLLVRAARAYGVRGVRMHKEVTLPAVLPFFVTGVRLAIGKAMIGVVVGEYIAATQGLGFRIRANAEVFNTPDYLAGVMVVVVAAVLLTSLVKQIERRMAPWRRTSIDDA